MTYVLLSGCLVLVLGGCLVLVAFRRRQARIEATAAARAAELRESEARYRQLVELAPGAVCLVARGRVVYLNPAGLATLGARDPSEIIGREVLDFVHPSDREQVARSAAWVQSTRRSTRRFPLRVLRIDGTAVEVEGVGAYVEYQGEPALQAIFDDLTVRQSVEEALLASEERYRRLVETFVDAVIVTDEGGAIRLANPAAAELIGVPVAGQLGRRWTEFVAPADRPAAEACLKDSGGTDQRPSVLEVEVVRPSGQRVVVTVRCAPLRDPRGTVVGFITVIRDASQLKQLEAQFHQAQKLEAVGQLAGGIAHDFNNLTMVILNCADAALDRTPEEDLRWWDLQEIRKAGERAADLTRQLLAFSRRQRIEPGDIEVSEAVQQLAKMLRRLLGEQLALDLELPARAGVVRVDPAQFQQVLLNLAVNARDAMPAGGRLRIAAERTQVGPGAEGWPLPPPPGSYVCLTVADQGAGIDPEVLPKIFEPFFTTKATGKGTGLGLAMVYGAVQQNHGFLVVDSRVGHGTTFRIFLPLARTTATEPAYPATATHLQGMGERLLVVEDEAVVQSVLSRALGSAGYRVDVAADGAAGLERFRAEPTAYALVLTDVVMPGMNGVELAERLAEIRADVRVVFFSGYPDDLLDACGIPERGWPLLRKPLDRQRLLETVKRLLRRGSSSDLRAAE